jgi:hypothetical protein
MAVTGNTVFVAAQDGTKYGLYTSGDSGQTWLTASLPPGNHPSGSEKGLAITAAAGEVVAAGDDGTTARIWTANYSAQ